MPDTPITAAPEPSPTRPQLPGNLDAATYTIPDIARMTQSSERHIHRLNDLGRIPGRIKGLGRLVRFSKAAVDAWLAGLAAGRA
jgi:excisionase family DNA binding protein